MRGRVFPVDTRSSREITEEEEAIAIKVLWKKGMPQEDIAQIFGVTHQAVSKRLIRMGISKEELALRWLDIC